MSLRPRGAVALALVFSLAGPLSAEPAGKPITITATAIDSFASLSDAVNFGPLQWRGGLELSSPDKRFGGFSGLALSADGSRLLAVSDRGSWLEAELVYRDRQLAGIGQARLAPMLDGKGKPSRGKVRNDAEALAAWRPGEIGGKLVVGYESRVRIGTFETPASAFHALAIPSAIAKGPANRELEALGRFVTGPHKGSLIAISESHRDDNGDIRGWIFGGGREAAFAIKPHDDYLITDLAMLPDGGILTVERSYGTSLLPGMAIRHIRGEEIVEGGTLAPRLLFEARAPYYRIDNMEGIAVSRHGGELRVTLISDDNFDRSLQRTLLLQFALLR